MRTRPHYSLKTRERFEGQFAKKADGHLDIFMDSSGLNIFGEGGRKVHTHGKSKRRTVTHNRASFSFLIRGQKIITKAI